ncbi:MAG: AMP-binding protein [Proteobacteria bacterium]|nr:AMP-binding protein [Pseudomonadota bacterium]
MFDPKSLLEECEPQLRKSELSGEYYRSRVLRIQDTFPKILIDNAKTHPGRLSMRKKDFGIWNTFTWAEVLEKIRAISLGLVSLGLKREDKVCIIGDNDPEWYWAELAVHCAGGVVVGFYIDAMPSDIEFIANNSDTVYVFAKDQEQVDKFLDVKEKIPEIRRIIYWDDKGMGAYRRDPWLLEIEELMEAGRGFEKANPGFFEASVAEGKGSDLAALCYTSGTTGLPKGVMITHEYLVKATIRLTVMNPPQETDEFLSFVPPAWIAEQIMMAMWLAFSVTANFPEEPETVMENIREIGPSSLLLGPMQWLGLVSQVQMKIFETGVLRRLLYQACLAIGYRYADFKLERRSAVPWHWRLLNSLANGLCLMHIRDALGLSKTRAGITGGSALGPDVFRWFLAIGVKISDAYGLTEINPLTSHGEVVKPGTSGRPVPGVEVRISESGEIMARSDVMFAGYYKNPEATAGMLEDGWIKTGDCGTLDEDGHLIVYDRMKDMLPLRTGAKYSPSYIQNRLRFSPYIKDAMIIGGEDRDFLFGIVTIDFDNVGKWAEKNRISYTTFVDLSQKEEVYRLIERDVVQVNRTLPEDARLGRFTNLHKEFDADEGELTKTRKIRRAFLMERYGHLINAAYENRERVIVEAQVKYRDGREGTVKTDLKIRTVA